MKEEGEGYSSDVRLDNVIILATFYFLRAVIMVGVTPGRFDQVGPQVQLFSRSW